MSTEREHPTAEEKAAIPRRHLNDEVPVSTLCDEHQLHPPVFYPWLKQFFENGAAVFGSALRADKQVEARGQTTAGSGFDRREPTKPGVWTSGRTSRRMGDGFECSPILDAFARISLAVEVGPPLERTDVVEVLTQPRLHQGTASAAPNRNCAMGFIVSAQADRPRDA